MDNSDKISVRVQFTVNVDLGGIPKDWLSHLHSELLLRLKDIEVDVPEREFEHQMAVHACEEITDLALRQAAYQALGCKRDDPQGRQEADIVRRRVSIYGQDAKVMILLK